MDEILRRRVWERAGFRCEYCRLPQDLSALPFQIDHIIAIKHHGRTVLENLALACYYCNSFKGPNIGGFDLELRELTRLFHPRLEKWSEHFQWNKAAVLLGTTAVGRTTIDVLNISTPDRIKHRRILMDSGSLVLGD